MAKRSRGKSLPSRDAASSGTAAALRIVGGELRGRSFRYNGDPELRPMKDRVREAVFNLLGPAVRGLEVLDLFGGTGAMAFEAISRGADSAIIIERHFPSARMIRENAALLGIAERVVVRAGDSFVVHQQLPPAQRPCLVFYCPPYELYVKKTDEIVAMISRLRERALPGSLLVVESDERFDALLLPDADAWDVRTYPPAVIAVYDKAATEAKDARLTSA
jgi:16S rRNA (guanine966-N2)-methyltransferase